MLDSAESSRHARKDLHGRLGVGVVGWLEAQLLQAQAVKKLGQHAYEVAQGQPIIAHHT